MRVLLLIGAALALLGCGGLKGKVVGTWKVDMASIKSAELDAWRSGKSPLNVEGSFENTRYVFQGNGDMEVQSTRSDSKLPGTWELSGQKIVVSLLVHSNGFGSNPTMTISQDGSKIHVQESPGTQYEAEFDLVKGE